MDFATDLKTKMLSYSTPLPLVLMPDQEYAMEQKGFDNFLQTHGTNGWVYIQNPILIFSEEAFDHYLISISVYAKTYAKLVELVDLVRKSVVGVLQRQSSIYKFLNYQLDPNRVGDNHAILSFEAVTFFNSLP